MASYELTHDVEAGRLICRLTGAVPDEDAWRLIGDIIAATAAIRARHGTIRMLFDNRAGTIFSTGAMKVLVERLQATSQPGDRTAILVATSLHKLQAKRAMSETSQVFISEAAAMTWVDAWTHNAA